MLTPLSDSDYGIAVATDLADPNVTITSNATSTFPVGTTTVVWTATDDSGNSATAMQSITVRDTTPPTINAPATIRLNATGIMTWANLTGTASVSDAVDDSPVLEGGAPQYFAPGNTVMTWQATDHLGNTASADTTVIVSADTLDTEWQYKMTSHVAVASTKSFDGGIELRSSNVGRGTTYLFKSFPTDSIENHAILINSTTNLMSDITVSLLDGSYSNTKQSDWTSSDPVTKGNGTLVSYQYADLPASGIMPDWSGQQLEEVTLMFSFTKQSIRGNLKLDSIEIDNHSVWDFDDYVVDQQRKHGKYVWAPPSETARTVHTIPTNDTFDGPRFLTVSNSASHLPPMDGWTPWGSTVDYTYGRDTSSGQPSPSAYIKTNGFGVFTGISKTFDVSGIGSDQRLVISYDYRAAGRHANSVITNSLILLYDADSRDILLNKIIVGGGTLDTGWQRYTEDLTDYASEIDSLQVVLYLNDGWIGNYNHQNWYDNIRVYTVDQSEPVPTTNTYVRQSTEHDYAKSSRSSYNVTSDT